MRPYDILDTDQFIGMESDNHPGDADKWSILHNGDHVSIHAPNGDGFVSIPTEQFNAIVDWYITDQKADA